jgi:hypothetical protein
MRVRLCYVPCDMRVITRRCNADEISTISLLPTHSPEWRAHQHTMHRRARHAHNTHHQ